MLPLPAGFLAHVGNAGVKDDTDDVLLLGVTGGRRVPAAAVFTKSRFAGPSVTRSRAHVADGHATGVVVVSKNANVANGKPGDDDAAELCALAAARLGCAPEDVLVASTGVIGRRYPMDRLRSHLEGVDWPGSATADGADAAVAIMTTDTLAKAAVASAGPATVLGIAKGVGMIEPDMATMLAFVLTDAEVAPADLDAVFRRVVDRTLNCVSVDTDTSTSDTAVVLASGDAGPVELADLEGALDRVLRSLTLQIARDGEGATKLLTVVCTGARDAAQAKRVAKAVVNSPLVKTAVHGADPNWGRVAMAIGKCSDEADIDQEKVTIRFGEQELYPTPATEADLARLAEYLQGGEVEIGVDLAIADGAATVWGCDLSDGYVRINADYTT